MIIDKVKKKIEGSTEIWTRIAGFKVQSANRYTIEPRYNSSLKYKSSISHNSNNWKFSLVFNDIFFNLTLFLFPIKQKFKLNYKFNLCCKKIFKGSTEIWTRIAGFKVQSANRYTIEPCYTISIKKRDLLIDWTLNCLILYLKIYFNNITFKVLIHMPIIDLLIELKIFFKL